MRGSWDHMEQVDMAGFAAHVIPIFGPDYECISKAAGWLLDFATHDSLQRLWPPVRVIVRKQIADESSFGDTILELDELVSVPFHVHDIKEVGIILDPGVRFFDKGYFLGGSCVGAFRMRLSISFGKGSCVHDYLDRPRPSFWNTLFGGRKKR